MQTKLTRQISHVPQWNQRAPALASELAGVAPKLTVGEFLSKVGAKSVHAAIGLGQEALTQKLAQAFPGLEVGTGRTAPPAVQSVRAGSSVANQIATARAAALAVWNGGFKDKSIDLNKDAMWGEVPAIVIDSTPNADTSNVYGPIKAKAGGRDLDTYLYVDDEGWAALYGQMTNGDVVQLANGKYEAAGDNDANPKGGQLALGRVRATFGEKALLQIDGLGAAAFARAKAMKTPETDLSDSAVAAFSRMPVANAKKDGVASYFGPMEIAGAKVLARSTPTADDAAQLDFIRIPLRGSVARALATATLAGDKITWGELTAQPYYTAISEKGDWANKPAVDFEGVKWTPSALMDDPIKLAGTLAAEMGDNSLAFASARVDPQALAVLPAAGKSISWAGNMDDDDANQKAWAKLSANDQAAIKLGYAITNLGDNGPAADPFEPAGWSYDIEAVDVKDGKALPKFLETDINGGAGIGKDDLKSLEGKDLLDARTERAQNGDTFRALYRFLLAEDVPDKGNPEKPTQLYRISYSNNDPEAGQNGDALAAVFADGRVRAVTVNFSNPD